MTPPPPTSAANPTTYVIGHRNPDADSVCAALAYAAFKEARGERGYVPARCGNTNARIDTILTRFHQAPPLYLSDVSPRVRDFMVTDVFALDEHATCAEALAIFDQHDIRVLPITGRGRQIVGTVSLSTLGGVFIPRLSEPRRLRLVRTSLANITRTLEGHALHLVEKTRIEELYVRLGTMDITTFWSISIRENIPAAQSIIIVGDRRDIQRRAIEIGVRALVITSNLGMDAETLELARTHGTSVIISPYDSATTSWIVRTASTLERVVEPEFVTVDADQRIADVRKRFSAAGPHALLVTHESGTLEGILTKSDVLRPSQTRLVLVDHNEMSQAVPGADEVTITEIIDHHRLGPLNTPQPILFLNEPVGSTCTIVADLFRREGLQPTPDIAGVMMGGLISDTLHLNGPTTTPKDVMLLGWLAGLAGVDPAGLADQIFNSGSVILAQSPAAVVRSDHKVYEEEGVRFAVSQVEELGFGNFSGHAGPIAAALQELCDEEQLAFAALLVTDINTQNSLLLVKGDPGFIDRISYPHNTSEDIFDLPGVVSRKKQLIPYLTSVLKEMATEGTLPRPDAPAPRRVRKPPPAAVAG